MSFTHEERNRKILVTEGKVQEQENYVLKATSDVSSSILSTITVSISWAPDTLVAALDSEIKLTNRSSCEGLCE
jgi:hypothetical protein